MIVLFDTSVLFSAFAFKHGLCGKIFRASLGRHELATCTHIIDELNRHLAGKTSLSAIEIEEVLAIVREAGPMVVPETIDVNACRDPADLPILGAAVSAKAGVLVTGDKDLLVLGSFKGIAILSPRQFHDRCLADEEWGG